MNRRHLLMYLKGETEVLLSMHLKCWQDFDRFNILKVRATM